MAYGGNPSGSTSDALRLSVGDTSTTAPILSDSEVSYYVSLYGPNLKAASYAAAAIAAKYASQVSQSFGEGSVQLDQLFQHFKQLSSDLLAQYNQGLNSFTALSVSEIGVINDSIEGNFPPRQRLSDIAPEEFGSSEG